MGKIIPLVLLLIGLKSFGQIDSFPRIKEFSGHILIEKKDTLIHHYFGESTLSPSSDHSESSYVNLVSFSSLIINNIADSLKKQRKLSYDEKVQTYITSFQNENLKISDLINHTTGINIDIWQLFRKEVIRGQNTFCSQTFLDNECLIDLVLQHDSLGAFKHSEFQYSPINTVLLVKVMEISTGLSIDQIISNYSQGVLKNDFTKPLPQGQYINYYGKIVSLNSSLEFGLPFDISLTGSSDIYIPVKEVIKNLNQNLDKAPALSGNNGFYAEVYQENNHRIYIFLNRISEKENLEEDLKTYIRQHLLQ